MARSRFCSHSGDGPFLTPRTSLRPKAGQSDGGLAEVERDRDRAGAGALHRRDRPLDQAAEAGGGEVARDAATPSASGRFGVTATSITGSSSPA